MNDGDLYTGVDGIFGNEIKDEEVTETIKEQDDLLKRVTPELEAINKMLDDEIKGAESVRPYFKAAEMSDSQVRAELQAAARYVVYVEGLKNKFSSVLKEVRDGRRK